MRLCTDNITVYNSYIDPTTKYRVYLPTQIFGVSWYGSVQVVVTDNGLVGANQFTIRIPTNATVGSSKTYVTPKEFENKTAAQKPNFWTLADGDIIVKGLVTDTGTDAKPDKLEAKYNDVIKILSVTDNRRVNNAPHWRVVCK